MHMSIVSCSCALFHARSLDVSNSPTLEGLDANKGAALSEILINNALLSTSQNLGGQSCIV